MKHDHFTRHEVRLREGCVWTAYLMPNKSFPRGSKREGQLVLVFWWGFSDAPERVSVFSLVRWELIPIAFHVCLNIGFCIPILLARRQVHWRCPFCAPSSKVRCGCWRWPCFAPRWPARGCRSVGMLRSWSNWSVVWWCHRSCDV